MFTLYTFTDKYKTLNTKLFITLCQVSLNNTIHKTEYIRTHMRSGSRVNQRSEIQYYDISSQMNHLFPNGPKNIDIHFSAMNKQLQSVFKPQ